MSDRTSFTLQLTSAENVARHVSVQMVDIWTVFVNKLLHTICIFHMFLVQVASVHRVRFLLCWCLMVDKCTLLNSKALIKLVKDSERTKSKMLLFCIVLINLIWVLLEIYCSLQQWKNFANRSRIDKVIAMVRVAPFFDSRCIWICNPDCHQNLIIC